MTYYVTLSLIVLEALLYMRKTNVINF